MVLAGEAKAGAAVAELSHRLAPNLREVWLEIEDTREERHWLWHGDCWCEKRHQAGESLSLVPPPSDRSRDEETAVPAVAW